MAGRISSHQTLVPSVASRPTEGMRRSGAQLVLETTQMRIIPSMTSLVLLLLPNLAKASYGEPLPSVEANFLVSPIVINLAIDFYVLAFGLCAAITFTARKNLVTFGRSVTLTAIVLHASGYLLRWKELYNHGWGRFPLSSLYEAFIIYCLMLAATSLFLQMRTQRELIALFFHPIVIGILIFAGATQSAGITALYDPRYFYKAELLESIKFTQRLEVLEILLLAAGYCLLTSAGVVSLILLISRISARKSTTHPLFPSNRTLYDWNKTSLVVGTVLFALGFIVGRYWENSAWGGYWFWEPCEMSGAITLITYAVFGLRNRQQGWDTSKATNRSIIGLCILAATYYIANHLFRGI